MVQEGQIFQEKQKEFILTCQNFIASTFQLFHPEKAVKFTNSDFDDNTKPASLFPSYPFVDNQCPETTRNTYFNFSDVTINPTKKDFGENCSDDICKSETCMSFHEYPPSVRDNVISPAHWCNHSKINLDFVPEAQDEITDIRKDKSKKTNLFTVPEVPQIYDLSQPGPQEDIWPNRQPTVPLPPDDKQNENIRRLKVIRALARW